MGPCNDEYWIEGSETISTTSISPAPGHGLLSSSAPTSQKAGHSPRPEGILMRAMRVP